MLLVVTHWGTQYTNVPEASQRMLGRACSMLAPTWWSAAIRTGSRASEVVGDKLIAHSLGNFVFDMDFQSKTMEGVFVEIVLWGEQVKAVEAVAYRLDRRFVPRVVTGAAAADILADVWSTGRGPYARP